MTSRISHTTELPADVATVFAALTGPGWAQRKADRLHDGSAVVGRDADSGGGVTIAVSRELPEGGPGFLRRFLPADGRVVQTDCWQPPGADGVRTGRWELAAAGVPAQIGGPLRLEPTAAGCRQVVAGEVNVTIPLIGGKAERTLADMLGHVLTREGELLAEWMAEPPS